MIYSLAFKKNNGIVTIKPVEKLDSSQWNNLVPRISISERGREETWGRGLEVGRVRKSVPLHNAPNKPQNENISFLLVSLFCFGFWFFVGSSGANNREPE